MAKNNSKESITIIYNDPLQYYLRKEAYEARKVKQEEQQDENDNQ